MVFRKPRLGLGRFLNLRMTQILLVHKYFNKFKYHISKYALHNCLHHTPIADGIKIYATKSNNKIGRKSNIIWQYTTAKNTPRKDSQN